MKVNWNRKYTTIAVYSLTVIILAVLFIMFVFKFESIKETFSWIGNISAPIICSIVIAYILNPLMVWIENKLFGKWKVNIPQNSKAPHFQKLSENKVIKRLEKQGSPLQKKTRTRKIVSRAISLSLTFIIFFAVLAGIAIAIVPNVSGSIVSLADNMDSYKEKIDNWVKNAFEKEPEIMDSIFKEMNSLEKILSNFAEQLKPYAGNIVSNVSGFVASLIAVLKNFVLGFIIAMYLLFSKERLMAQMKKIVCAFMKPCRAESVLRGCTKSNNIFKKYVISNLLDSLIIMLFMLIGMFSMGMPYAVLLSVVCGVTNLVPFFGPFIGAIPCGLVILLVDPSKVIWFAIFVLVLQQLDGNVIKPLLFGETMGLPALWVLISITIGGALFGIPGMLLGAPVFAVFYMLFADAVRKKLKLKNLPEETEIYELASEELSADYLQKAIQPGKTPVSFEDSAKPEAQKTEKELPEPISEKTRNRKSKK